MIQTKVRSGIGVNILVTRRDENKIADSDESLIRNRFGHKKARIAISRNPCNCQVVGTLRKEINR